MELRDLYDENKNVTGLTFVKGQQVPKGYYYLITTFPNCNTIHFDKYL